MYLKKETLEIQNNLGDYCRTGVYKNIDGVSQERLTHYRRLVFGNVKSVLEKAYPITLEWLSEDEWLILVNDFFEFHDSQSPKIWELPQEFMEFVKTNGYDRKFDKPALNDLLLIEWIEIEVHTMMDIEVAAHRKHGDLLNDALVLNATDYDI